MEPRSLTIGLVVVVVAFAAAFGLAKATSSPATPERAGAAVITPAAPSAIAGIEAGGAMPALRTSPDASSGRAPAKSTTTAREAATSKSPPAEPSTPGPSTPKATTPSAPAPGKPTPKAPVKPQPTTVEGEINE